MRIALDMDGVIAKGPYIPKEQRTHETYMAMEPYDQDTLDIFEFLIAKHECYIITARKYKESIESIKFWFDNQLDSDGFTWSIAGIITGIPASEKYHLATILHCDLIVDDSPRVWQDWRTSGCRYIAGGFAHPQMFLMDNPAMAANQACTDHNQYIDSSRYDATHVRVRSWKELGERIASFNSRLIQKS